MSRRAGGKKRRPPARRRPARGSRAPSFDDIADTILRGGAELLELDDPLDAESWASAMLGTFYKIDGPLQARNELEKGLWPAVVRRAETRGDEGSVAVLEALAAIADAPLRTAARQAANRLRVGGVAAPAWAAELGTAAFESAWMMTDVFEDHEAYFATFRYPGRPAHVVNALYDKAMGEIIKDGFVGYTKSDLRAMSPSEPGVAIVDIAPDGMTRRIVDAIETGDTYLDNDWTPEFKQFRALILTRMRGLPMAPQAEPAEPPDEDARALIVDEFLSSAWAPHETDADLIVSHALDYTCDYLGEGPYRWSPIVVELFMLDYLPRKVLLPLDQVRSLPAVLEAWVHFAGAKRGLESRWVEETTEAVREHSAAFRSSITDAGSFGPAKQVVAAMFGDGVDFADASAVERWISERNRSLD